MNNLLQATLGLAELAQAFDGVVRKIEEITSNRALMDIFAERQRQVSVEGWTPDHDDDAHDSGDLAAAASAYALAACDRLNPYSQGDGGFDASLNGGLHDEHPPMWPDEWPWKPASPRRMLEKAGALILAEIERIDRKEARNG